MNPETTNFNTWATTVSPHYSAWTTNAVPSLNAYEQIYTVRIDGATESPLLHDGWATVNIPVNPVAKKQEVSEWDE